MSFDEHYFSTHTYANVSFGKFSQYWWSNRFYARLARRYGEKGSKFLEIGSGLGHLVGQLENDFQTTGLDINYWAINRSKEIARKTGFGLGSAGLLPYATHSFGVVILKHVVEHLPDPERCIQELGRIIVPGGIVILATPNLDSMMKPLKGKSWIGYQDPTHISLKPPKEWIRLMQEAGFSHLRVFSDGFWDVPYFRFIPAKLQKILFGSLGGIQAILSYPFLPKRWGESIILIARQAI